MGSILPYQAVDAAEAFLNGPENYSDTLEIDSALEKTRQCGKAFFALSFFPIIPAALYTTNIVFVPKILYGAALLSIFSGYLVYRDMNTAANNLQNIVNQAGLKHTAQLIENFSKKIPIILSAMSLYLMKKLKTLPLTIH